MTQNDSFIHEVTEEVRREKLYRFFRRYGWVIVAAIVIIIAAAAINEWRKARAQAAAEATGDAMLAAFAVADPAAQAAALGAMADAGGSAAVLARFQQAASLSNSGNKQAAVAALALIAGDAAVPVMMQSMARLKMVMIQGPDMESADRLAILDELGQAGSPFRMLALEQRALVHAEGGQNDAAIADLMEIYQSAEAPATAKQRVGQLVIALGGVLPQAEDEAAE